MANPTAGIKWDTFDDCDLMIAMANILRVLESRDQCAVANIGDMHMVAERIGIAQKSAFMDYPLTKDANLVKGRFACHAPSAN